MTTTAVAWAALAIAVVAAICAALTYRLVTVDRHEIDLLRQRADKTDDRTAQLRIDIDATRDWTWDHHDAHGWGEEAEAEPAEPQHPPTALIAAQPAGIDLGASPNPYQRLQAGQPPTEETPRPSPGPAEPRRTRAEERAARREGTK